MIRRLSIASLLLLLAGCVSYYPAYRDDYGYYDGGYEGQYYEDDGYGYGSTAYPYADDYYGSYYPSFWSLGYGYGGCGGYDYYGYGCSPYGYGSGWVLSIGFGSGYGYGYPYYGYGGYPYYGGWYGSWYGHHHHHDHDDDDDDYDDDDGPGDRSIPVKPAHPEDMASRTAPGEYLRPTSSRHSGYRSTPPQRPVAGPATPMSKPSPYRTPTRRYREPTAPGDGGPVSNNERPAPRPRYEERPAARPRYAEPTAEPRYEAQQPRQERSMPRPQPRQEQSERSYERPQPSYERSEPRAERPQMERPAMRETRAPSQNDDRDSEL